MQKNNLSGSIINELEVAERDYRNRLKAIAKINEIKDRKIESIEIIKEENCIRTIYHVRKETVSIRKTSKNSYKNHKEKF